MVGLSAIAISIAGIMTTIILHGARATGKFPKALYNLSKKLGSLTAPLLNIIAQGLAWLMSNLQVLVVAFTLYLVGEYRKRRKMNMKETELIPRFRRSNMSCCHF